MLTGIPQECSALVEFQHGVIARWQAPRVGLRPAAIDGLLRSGRWRQLYRGVYAAYTGRPPRDAQLWAAALRCGPGAALSHHTAAELDGLTDRRQEVIHVTVGRDRRIRNPAGERRHELAPRIVLHRTDRIDAIRHPAKAPPRTRVAETVLDLTQLSLTFDEALSWLSRGCGRRLVTPQLIRTAVTTRRRVRWRDEILAALPLIADGVHSNLEFRYVSDVEKAHSLPVATRQARLVQETPFPRSRYLDNLYEPFGVGVELDGSAAHLVEDRWQDIHRDNFCARLGLIILRFSWADVTRGACAVAADVSVVLAQRGWTGRPSQCGPRCTLPD